MRRTSHRGCLLTERFLRGMALFFLFFTFSDIAFPPPCSEAKERTATTNSASALTSYDKTVTEVTSVAHDDSCPNGPPEKQCNDEDCCFRCAHMLAIAAITGAVASDLRSAGTIPSDVFVPAPPLRLTDHPPRLA